MQWAASISPPDAVWLDEFSDAVFTFRNPFGKALFLQVTVREYVLVGRKSGDHSLHGLFALAAKFTRRLDGKLDNFKRVGAFARFFLVPVFIYRHIFSIRGYCAARIKSPVSIYYRLTGRKKSSSSLLIRLPINRYQGEKSKKTMIVNLPRFGTGIRPIFEGSPLRVSPVAGRLAMAGNNVAGNRNIIQRVVASSNAQARRDAKENKSFLDIKA